MSKEYAVAFSGHGSSYRFDYPPPIGPLYTLDEALLQVDRWVLKADTIGGRGIAIHMPSWKGSRKNLPFIDEVNHLLAEGDVLPAWML
jgi:hypothetical protein